MDSTTMVLALALGNLSLCAALFFFEHVDGRPAALSAWGWGRQYQAAGWLLLAIGAAGVMPDWLAFPVAYVLVFTEGGGRVVIPKGDWFCAGPIVLLSNVNVHLQAGAHVYFSNDPRDYAKYGAVDCGANGKLAVSRWQSNDCLNFSSMIYAHDQDNIALTGDDWTAILDGQGGVPFGDKTGASGTRKADYLITDFGAAPCKLAPVKAWISFEEQDTVQTPAPGSRDCYAAIRDAIARCHAEGGGRVVIPKGDWFCAGPIVLLSNVNVHLQAGAHVYFSNDPRDYAKYGAVDCGANGKLAVSRWQSNDCLNFSSMIYAHDQDNIALTGDDWTAILDGQGGVPFGDKTGASGTNAADCWWTWKGKNATINSVAQDKSPNYVPGKLAQNQPNPNNPTSLAEIAPNLPEAQRLLIQGEGDKWRADDAFLPALSEAGVPLAKRVFGLGHYLRPPMIHLIGCTNVLLQGYQVTHTPFWQHHPVACRNLTIRNVYANSLGPNSDGFDPESCDGVLVEGCQFDTGDDCIAIKAGKNLDTQYGPSQNIVIQKCTMHSGHGAVTLGSEMSAGIQNVYAQDLVFENKNWATNPLNIAIRLKTNMNRGGFLRHFYVRNVSIPNGVQTTPSFYATLPGSPIPDRSVAAAAGGVVTFDCDYTPRADNVRIRPPEVSNVHISNVKVGNVTTKDGKRFSSYQAVVILGPVAFDYNGPNPRPPVLPVRDVTITDCDFGTPSNADKPWFVHNVKNVRLQNVTIAGKKVNTTLST